MVAFSPGTRVGSYEIVSRIGAGGMGEVYRARDPRLGRDVAVKVLPSDIADDPERRARFEREARPLASLNHPHIAQVYSFEASTQDGGAPNLLVRELVEGEDLAERLARGPLPLDDVLAAAHQIAQALEAAHEQGTIHRDSNRRISIYVVPFPGPGERRQISASGGGMARWRSDGLELFYIALDGRMMAVPIRRPGAGQLDIGTPTPLFMARIGGPMQSNSRAQYIVSTDGQSFLVNTLAEVNAAPIVVMLNWKEVRAVQP